MHIEQSFDAMFLAGLYSFVIFVGSAFFYQRFRWRRRKARGKGHWGFYPGAASLGNALHQLSAIAEAQAQHAITEMLEEESEDDEEGAPNDPVAHLHRQARKIRRGEEVDRLTAIRSPVEESSEKAAVCSNRKPNSLRQNCSLLGQGT